MSKREHFRIIKRGVDAWNQWRKKNRQVMPDLSWADLSQANLGGADLSDANLMHANLSGANLCNAMLRDANLYGAKLSRAKLSGAMLWRARLNRADLRWADLNDADLTAAHLLDANLYGAKLVGTDLRGVLFVRTKLSKATLIDCHVYGISAWGTTLSDVKEQKNLRVTPSNEPEVTVDNLEVAQFVYLLLHNEKIRSIIDTIGQKGVLILGRFTKERKIVLEAIREKLRELGFVPMMFDFKRPTQRDFTETIMMLAGMCRFIIADITNPKSSPLEVQAIVPNYMIPLVPICDDKEEPFSMFRDLQNKYSDWVLDLLQYDSPDHLIQVLEQAVVQPALEKASQLMLIKAEEIRKRHVKDFPIRKAIKKKK